MARTAAEKPSRPPQKVGLLRVFKATSAVARYCARNAGTLLLLIWFPCLIAALSMLALDFLTLAYPPRLPDWLLASHFNPPTWLTAGWVSGMIPPVKRPPVATDPVPAAGHRALATPPRHHGL